MQLQRTGTSADLLNKGVGATGIAFTSQQNIDRQPLTCLKHATNMPWPRCAGRGVGAGCPTRAPAYHGGNAAGDGFFDLLRRDKVNMGVNPARRHNLAFSGDDFGTWPDNDINSGLNVRIAGFNDLGDVPARQANIGFDDTPM